MGIDFYVEDSSGKIIQFVGDPNNFFNELLRNNIEESSKTLRFIDEYGDTVFNHLQHKFFISELQSLSNTIIDKNLIEFPEFK
jgi:hypothetical protein